MVGAQCGELIAAFPGSYGSKPMYETAQFAERELDRIG